MSSLTAIHGLSIVIPCRNDPMVAATVRRIRETVRVPHEIIVIDDGSDDTGIFEGLSVRLIRNSMPCGAGRSRDQGIRVASYDAVLAVDAHVNFHPDDWSERIVAHLSTHPRDVCCCLCPQLSFERTAMEEAVGAYYGARLRERDQRDIEICRDGLPSRRTYRRLLAAEWNTDESLLVRAQAGEAVEIGCVLGGAYALRRSWYLDGLRAPWQRLTGWGSEEQHLSIPNYLLGGRNVLLPVAIGHMFRSRAPYATDVAHLLFNMALLVHLFLPDDEVAREYAWLMESWQGHPVATVVDLLLHRSDWRAHRDELARGLRSWQDYREKWVVAV